MTGYDLALFLHLLALSAAFGASTVIHTAMPKAAAARTGREAVQWLGVAHSLARVFPAALLVLSVSGGWMVHDRWRWESGFVVVGLAAAAFLFVSGAAIEGGRGRKVAAALAGRPDAAVEGETAALLRDPVWWTVSWGNTGIAVGVVFAMTVKPSAVGSAAAVLAGLALGALVGLVARPAPAYAAAAQPAGG